MKKIFDTSAASFLGKSIRKLNPTQQKIVESISEQTTVSENVNDAYTEQAKFGQRVADKVASFGGSWKFIGIFFAVIGGWILLNIPFFSSDPFDPYPFILLNLCLSTLAAFQAPIIMMSQNRQAAKDRIKQDLSYEINLKLELQVMQLNEKLDQMLQHKSAE